MFFLFLKKQAYCLLLRAICLLLFNLYSVNIFAQLNKIWMCENEGFYFWTCNDTSNADMSFKIDFNFEPPQYKLIKKPVTKNAFLAVRNLSANDKKGNILIYDNNDHYFINKKNEIIYNKNKLSHFSQSSSALIFPTSNDSLHLIVSLLDTLLFNKSNLFGEIFFKKHLFNSNQNKFKQIDMSIDFGVPTKYNPLKHIRSDLRTGFACYIFNQIYDEKDDKYFIYFNLGDSIYISEYHKQTMSFDIPKTSGLIISGRGDRSVIIGINFTSSGSDDIIHSTNNNFILHQNLNTERLVGGNPLTELSLYSFNKNTGQFYSPLLIDSARSLYDWRFTSKIFAPCDSILYYFKWSYNGNSNKLVKVVLNKDMNKILNRYEYVFNEFTPFADMKLAPNGKIVASVHFRYSPTVSNVIRFINNPNDPSSTFKISNAIDYTKDLEISCQDNYISFFPNTPGLYKKADFTYRDNCKKNSVVFTNHSDTFWFKNFIFYLGNGDSIKHNFNQNSIIYQYQNPGKYFVKMKAFTKEGGWVWYSDTIEVKTAPSAYFTTQPTQGCQYIAFQFKDSSMVYQIKKDSAVRHSWQFGDGASNYWQTYGINIRQNKAHTYTQNGTYTVSHTVSDGYCTDTFTRISQVNIQAAPKPGIVASTTWGCAPLVLTLSRQYTDAVDSVLWIEGANKYKTIGNNALNITLTKVGKATIYQHLYGSTGCITKDTISINVLQGINKNAVPNIVAASVIGNGQIFLNWQSIPLAKTYTLKRNNTVIATLPDTFYIDNTNTLQSQIYSITAQDTCNNTTQSSAIAKTILLTAKKDKNNICVLRWNPYLTWANGVQLYNTIYVSDYNQTINSKTDTSYTDNDFLQNGKTEKCYQIQAIENGGNNAQSQSNMVCIPYESVIWIPTAISINGDGKNESLKINTFGIKSYTLSIYNRWGQKVFESSNIADEWQPTPQQQGVYMYVVKAETNDGRYITKGTITVLR